MKSLLVSPMYFPPMTGGISRMMEQISLALGPERICCLTGVKANPKELQYPSAINVYRRPRIFYGNKYARAVHLFLTLMEIFLKDRPKVMQLSTCSEGYIGLLAKRWLNLPFVMYAHGNEILTAINSESEKKRYAMRRANCILANSRYTAKLVESAGVRSEAIKIIPLGCDTEKFRPHESSLEFRRRILGWRENDHIILSVGNLVERKGHDMVIKALPLIRKVKPDVTYLIVGNGPYKKHLEWLASSLGVQEKVIFAGRVSDEELPDFYSLCDVFTMPSRERPDSCDVEGFGLVYLEAGASGKAVVGGRSGGVEDAVIDGFTGLLVDPYDVEGLCFTLTELLSNDQLRTKLGKQGLKRVQKEYNWEIVGKRIQCILEQVVSSMATA
jgi:phosphatidyl-myo-inositol dimannoside synthase